MKEWHGSEYYRKYPDKDELPTVVRKSPSKERLKQGKARSRVEEIMLAKAERENALL